MDDKIPQQKLWELMTIEEKLDYLNEMSKDFLKSYNKNIVDIRKRLPSLEQVAQLPAPHSLPPLPQESNKA